MDKPFEDHGLFSWSELITPDFKQACRFYESMLGWKLKEVLGRNGSRYALVTSDNATEPFAGILTVNDKDIRAHWRTYVTVDEVEAIVNKTELVGGLVLVPVTTIERVGKIAVIEDPCGAVISVIEYDSKR
ncbi:VOC family protein [Vibrio mediterranei]|uniref:VOC family protein n=1 Tax=Vibrio mediterranei TaxID=689 RepID=UPI001EFD8A63|nr:VOC family protein [Vibrio mediterranei]